MFIDWINSLHCQWSGVCTKTLCWEFWKLLSSFSALYFVTVISEGFCSSEGICNGNAQHTPAFKWGESWPDLCQKKHKTMDHRPWATILLGRTVFNSPYHSRIPGNKQEFWTLLGNLSFANSKHFYLLCFPCLQYQALTESCGFVGVSLNRKM